MNLHTKQIAAMSVALTLLLSMIGCTGSSPQATKNEEEKQIKKTQQLAIKDIQQDQRIVSNEAQQLVSQPMPSQQFSRHKMAQPMNIMPIPHPTPTTSEKYQQLDENGVKQVSNAPLSTFSIDVDTGSYANVRRFIDQGQLPPKGAVRVEEMLNYFDYHQLAPQNNTQPFSVNTELMTAPWNSDRQLLKIGLKGYDVPKDQLGNANLVFLLDVSGSMNSARKLPLLKQSLKMLTKQLDADDRVSIVVYAGAAGMVLKPTPGNEYSTISNALNKLSAGGSTNGAQGIELAYNLASENFIKDGINRVILATDGDFNVGLNNVEQLKEFVKQKRKQGIALTTLGFGQGNYNDHLMEQIADVGNGNYAYIDNINEARKVLVDELSSTLNTIAHDVKIQVEFNPNLVSEYRLIGYENRALANEDFNNDKVDAGEIGAGHQVTALYELTLNNAQQSTVDTLKYQTPQISTNSSLSEIAQIKLRYKLPNQQQSKLISQVVNKDQLNTSPSQHFKFASAVAAFSQSLRGTKYLKDYSIDDMIILAQENKGQDNFGYRSEFIQMLRSAKDLETQLTTTKDLSSSVQIIN
ncbi:vWA domain-containing protein [Psychrobium sp. nBUS_13]|uniref:vWA domain-containing protein n=1 Tax=Psychrobium sp. nBUS_13 TaxID=3395319 RepID=UPI003EBFCCE8